MPVCIDWITRFTVQNGLVGKVKLLGFICLHNYIRQLTSS